MNATDVIGWVVDGEHYCDNCTPTKDENNNDVQPIFAESETDSFSHCCVCEELIPENLTVAGMDAVLRKMEAYLIHREGRPEILHQWAERVAGQFGASEQPDEQTRALCFRATEEDAVKICKKNIVLRWLAEEEK